MLLVAFKFDNVIHFSSRFCLIPPYSSLVEFGFLPISKSQISCVHSVPCVWMFVMRWKNIKDKT